MEKLNQTVFYSIDKAIKTYRQFAQKNLKEKVDDITIDQWLVLKTLHEYPDISQVDLAEKVFKEYASITRIIDKLVQKNYLSRTSHPRDRRRFKLQLTKYALDQMEDIFSIVSTNRTTALEGICREDIDHLNETLNKIINNCQS